jgi:GGDEF domain-containing protein
LARLDDLAKGWLVALLEQQPLRRASGILAAELIRDGPRLCEAMVRALADESDLRRIIEDGPLEPLVSRAGELAGAYDAESTVLAVDTLEAVIWSAVRGELLDGDPGLVAALAERLSLIAGLVRAASLRRLARTASGSGAAAHLRGVPSPFSPSQGGRRAGEAGDDEPEDPEPAEAELDRAMLGGAEIGGGAVGVDTAGAVLGSSATGSSGAGGPGYSGAEIEMGSNPERDAVWIGALERELTRSERTGSPLSLLLLELEEAERVIAVESPEQAAATFGRFAQTVRGVMRRQDILACETDTRAWIIARDTSRAGAQALGARTVSALRTAQSWRGAPLTVSIGLAVLGEDGKDCVELIDSAEEARLAAAAEGTGLQGEPPVG